MSKLCRHAGAWLADRRAGIAMSFGLMAPALVMAVGFSLDFAGAIHQDRKLQEIADQAAIAAARELAVGRPKAAQVQAVAESYVAAALGSTGASPVAVTTSMIPDDGSITVRLQQDRDYNFSGLFSIEPPASWAEATARFVGSAKLCVVALGAANQDGLVMTKEAEIVAGGCGVYSNSEHKELSINMADHTTLTGAFTCAVGGIKQRDGAIIHGSATTDCPVFPDPLSARPKPVATPCKFPKRLVLTTGKYNLPAGRYCGGLEVTGNAEAILDGGEYTMQDGSLVVSGSANLVGSYSGFYFTGKNSGFQLLDNAVVELSAPKTGRMSGILFWKDPMAKVNHAYRISTNYARKLVGTIYLPGAELVVESDTSVAKNSAWTALVAESIKSTKKSKIFLNTNYDSTDVPVPKGFDDPSRRQIYLTD